MTFQQSDNAQFEAFTADLERLSKLAADHQQPNDQAALDKFKETFRMKAADLYRENRKLNLGVVGQVKAGKSSFLNTLLFDGREVLPKAATPKTATLTRMEYDERNVICVEYDTPDDWEALVENAAVDQDGDIYTSARELLNMAKERGLDVQTYLDKGTEEFAFDSYDELVAHLNDYVGENGKFTPIVKSVTLRLHNEDFRGLSIVDTPGLNDPIVSRTMRTREFMEVCDVVFFLSQTGSFLDKSDWELLSSQLPQKGVKKLLLIGSKYDSGVRDVLRKPTEEDELFGPDENTAFNIPDACKLVQRKLRKRAKSKVKEFVSDLEMRDKSEMIAVVQQCAEPILVSALAQNMVGKPEEALTAEERNLYHALAPYSDDLQADLKRLGNFDAVRPVFTSVMQEKEAILEKKAREMMPTARAELSGLLNEFKKHAEQRLKTLSGHDREELLAQKEAMEHMIEAVKGDIASVFGDLSAKLETEKAKGIREIRESSKDYTSLTKHDGTVTRTGSYTTGFWFWKKRHYYTYEDRYSYFMASDAVENLRNYSVDAVNHVEKVFTEALELKSIKRQIMNVIVSRFDLGSDKFDASLFQVLVQEAVNAIEFPVFSMDISSRTQSIATRFAGEITSGQKQEELSLALTQAVEQIHSEMCSKLSEKVSSFKRDLNATAKKIEDKLLENVREEFDTLLAQYQNKEQEIRRYQDYVALLTKELNP